MKRTEIYNGYKISCRVIQNVKSVPNGNPDLEDNPNYNICYHNVVVNSDCYNQTRCVTTDNLEITIENMFQAARTAIDRKDEKNETKSTGLLRWLGFK